jgi:hypothetical protein
MNPPKTNIRSLRLYSAVFGIFAILLIGSAVFHRYKSHAYSVPLPAPKRLSGALDRLGYARPADNPAPPGDVFVPALEENAHPEAPVVYQYSAQAGAGESLILKGSGFSALKGTAVGSDTRVWIYSQTSADDGSLQPATLLQDSLDSITVNPPDGTPYGMFLLWMENRNGPGRPVRVNNTDAWWLRPNRAAPGVQVSVFGRNLSHQNGEETSFVYIRPWDAPTPVTSQPLRTVSVNPYRVTFELPTGIAPGTYEIWAHNGHGGVYGWTGPLRLEVRPPVQPFSGRRLDVTNYGASAAPGDDTAAIERAIRDLRAGDTLFFPRGRFTITRPLEISVGVSLEGESRDASTLEFLTGSGRAGSALRLSGFPARVRNIRIESLITTGLQSEHPVIFFDGRFARPSPAGAIVENTGCRLPSGQMYSCFGVNSVSEIRIENNEFIAGSALLIYRSHQILVTRNTFIGNWPDIDYSPLTAIGASVSTELEVTDNRAYSRNRSAGETLSRFYVAQGHSHGVTFNHYIARNNIENVGCQSQTCGENILIETPGTLYTGNATRVDELNFRLHDVSWKPGSLQRDDPWSYEPPGEHRPAVVVIQSGTGEGQYRQIVRNTADTITLDRPWNVPPDSSSILTIVTSGFHKVIYRNTINGWPGALHNPHGLNVGIQSYGSLLDSVIAENKVSTLSRGIEISSLVNRSCGFAIQGVSLPTSGNNCPTWGVVITGNEVSDTRRGITAWIRVEDPPRQVPGPAMLNNIIRNNRILDSEWKAISIGDTNRYRQTGDWEWNTLVESNYIENADVHIELFASLRNTLIRNNVLNNRSPNSMGIRFEMGVADTFLYDNSLQGEFTEPFSGNVTHGPVQTSARRVRISASQGESVEFPNIASVKNVGVLPMLTSAQAAAPWLHARLDKSILSKEEPSASLDLRLDPALEIGEHSTDITIAPDGAPPVTIGVQVSIKPK